MLASSILADAMVSVLEPARRLATCLACAVASNFDTA